jgi:hypothetical protein
VTLPPAGAVNRAVCDVDAGGWLRGIREVIGISRDLPGETPVSMNMWGFGAAAAAELGEGFRGFLAAHATRPDAEFLISDAVGAMVRDGRARVRVLSGPFTWAGMTHATDREAVVGIIRERIAAGEYPGTEG